MNKTVVGAFDNFDEAHRVVEELERMAVSASDINLVAGDPEGRHAARLGSSRDMTATGQPEGLTGVSDAGSTTGDVAAGAGTGAITGGVVGGAVGLMAGLAGLAIPGVGPLIAAGPIAAALTGAGVGVVAGGLIGGLRHIGVPHTHAEYYAESVKRGAALVTVRTDDTRADQIAELMRRHGAIDIEGRVVQWRQSGWSGFDPGAPDPIRPAGQPVAAAGGSATTAGTTTGVLSGVGAAIGDAATAAMGTSVSSTTTGAGRATPSRVGTGSGAHLTATMGAGTQSTMGEAGGNTSLNAAMGATEPTSAGNSNAPLGTSSQAGSSSQVGSTTSSMGALSGTGNPASASGVNDTTMGGTDAMYGTTAPPDATRSALPSEGAPATNFSGSGQQGATGTASGSASSGMSQPGSGESMSDSSMARSSAGMPQTAGATMPESADRPTLGDDLQHGEKLVERGTERTNDAIKPTVRGDSNRGGK